MKSWHPHEDVLEEYVFGRLDEPEAAPLEEHLLVCEPCRAKLQEIDDFVLVMKRAASDWPPQAPAPAGWWDRFSLQGLNRLRSAILGSLNVTPARAAIAGAVVALFVVAVVNRPPFMDSGGTDSTPVSVTLKALRGGQDGSTTAPARRPLALVIEVPDIAPCAQCRVDVVNESGRIAWSGTAAISGGRMQITVPVTLGSGSYWVRLYTGGADPSREFGLRLE